MKIYTIIIAIILFISLILLLNYIDIPNVYDFELTNNSTIKAGHREFCISPSIKTECMEGLECKLISDTPYENGICLKPEEKYIENSDGNTVNNETYIIEENITRINI